MNIEFAGSASHRSGARYRMAASFCAALLPLLAVSSSLASGPQYTFAGRIGAVTPALPPPWAGVREGDPWELTVCLDPAVPDLCALPDRGCYPAGTAVQLRIGGADQAVNGPATALITIIDAASPRGDSMTLSFRLPGDVRCTLNLTDPTGQALTSIALPECTDLSDPSQWSSTMFSLEAAGSAEATGRLTRVICTPRLACGPCPDCAADYNQDGGIDGSDVGGFFADWEAGLACADVNHDGGIDNGDVTRFFRLWENGICCPGSPDYNGDGELNCNDLCEFYGDHRQGRRCADINGDGATDQDDIARFLTDYIESGGTGCAGSGDFNLDGRTNCADACLFRRAFEASDLAADVNCDGQVDLEDALAFERAYALGGGTPCPRDGDFNLDGRVDCSDVCMFRRAHSIGASAADYNCDGQLDDADITLFLNAYIEAGGSECPAGADFNLDGRIDCQDLRGFTQAVASGNPAADFNCDGQFDDADRRHFFSQFLDLNHDGSINCRDLCIQIERVRTGHPAADMNCDGSVDLADLELYQALFEAHTAGPPCGPCI